MLNGPPKPRLGTVLSDLGAVRVQGADVSSFLQGQLSNDIGLLAPGNALLAGLHNPQGRTIAIMRLLMLGPQDVLAVLPRELAAAAAQRLSRYILRAKVKVTEASAEWQVFGVMEEAVEESAAAGSADTQEDSSALPRVPNAQVTRDSAHIVCVGSAPARWLVVVPASADPAAAMRAAVGSVDLADPEARQRWHALDIASGQPQVYGATSEQFVAQMLNLDAIGAISFSKGCYTGQEIIARTHYRGRVKRRMQRFRSLSATTLAPGDAGKLSDGRSFRVVDAVTLADGRVEFLAVAPLAHGDEEATDSAGASGSAALAAEALPLPYELP